MKEFVVLTKNYASFLANLKERKKNIFFIHILTMFFFLFSKKIPSHPILIKQALDKNHFIYRGLIKICFPLRNSFWTSLCRKMRTCSMHACASWIRIHIFFALIVWLYIYIYNLNIWAVCPKFGHPAQSSDN